MHLNCIGLIALHGFCAAWPMQDEPATSKLVDRTVGIRTQYLPIFNISIDTLNYSSHNLPQKLPHDVFLDEVQQRITYYPDDPPKGSELVLNIARSLFLAWINWRHVGIRKTKIIHWSRTFTFTYRPSLLPTVELMPQDVSLVLRKILEGVVNLSYWPGHVGAMIYDGDPENIQTSKVGSIHIDYDPSSRGTKTSLSAIDGMSEEVFPPHEPGSTFTILNSEKANNTLEAHNATNIGMPAELERTWLKSFARTMVIVTSHPHWRGVAHTCYPSTEPPFPFQVRFYDRAGQDEAHMEVYRWAGEYSESRLRWQEVAKAMLEWAARILRAGDGYWAKQDIILEGRMAARFWMVNDRRGPSTKGLMPS